MKTTPNAKGANSVNASSKQLNLKGDEPVTLQMNSSVFAIIMDALSEKPHKIVFPIMEEFQEQILRQYKDHESLK
jgi:hypothetical protein